MPEFVNVTTQHELDKAVADGNIPICRAGFFKASGSATVWASGSASVWASGSATVWASGSASVWASGSATVWASGSATVGASGSATVGASDSATVRASDSATVQAYDSATVQAYDSATVEASGSATVEAYGSASVWASGSATVEAAPYVAVHRFGNTPTISGGILIQVPECKTADEWLAYYGLAVARGSVVLFKAVDQNFRGGHGEDYTPGTTTTADDFDSRTACCNGLLFSPRPFMAQRYHHERTTRFVACRVKVADIVVLDGYGRPGDEVKARACKCLHEVDVDGEKLVAKTASRP